MPELLMQLALILVIARSLYQAVTVNSPKRQPVLECAYYISVALLGLWYLL